MNELPASKLLIYGAGGHGRVVADVARAIKVETVLFVDDAPLRDSLDGLDVLDAKCLSGEDWCTQSFLVAIGDNNRRASIFEKLIALGGIPMTLVHPSAVISPSARLGAGSVVCAGAVVGAFASIGRNCIVNTSSCVDHDCVLEDHCQLGPRVGLAGNVVIGAGAMLGIGAVIVPGLAIGSGSLIGAGSVVTRDVPSGVVAWGNPARVIRRIENFT